MITETLTTTCEVVTYQKSLHIENGYISKMVTFAETIGSSFNPFLPRNGFPTVRVVFSFSMKCLRMHFQSFIVIR